jgi:hypothetical protein
VQAALQKRRLHGRLRVFRSIRSLRGALWGTPKLRSAVLVGLALAAMGCGGAGAGDADPATAVPADAALYAEAVVRPEGSLREQALEAAGKVLLTDDPETEIRRSVERVFEHLELDYERDVKPWLGERAAIWMPARAELETAAMLLAAIDTDAALSSLEAALKRSGESPSRRSYRGNEYLVADDGAGGIVGDFLVTAAEADYKRTVDAFEGDSLAEADPYSGAVDELDDERLAHFWLDTAALFEQARAADPELGARADQLSSLVPLDELPPVVGSFAADGDRLAVEVRSRVDRGRFGSLLVGGSSPLVQEVPGDSWLALGSADVGESLSDTIDAIAGPIGGTALRREVRREAGLDLDRDVLDWIGDVAVFVRGDTPARLDGGLIIEPTDEERAADAFGRIVGAVQIAASNRARPVEVAGAEQAFEVIDAGDHFPIVLARGSGLVTVTVGRAAAEAALGSGDRLGETDLYSEAEELVGMEPSMLLSMPQVLELAGASGPDAEFREIEPYLEAFSVLAAGTVADGDELTTRFAAGLE